MHASTPKQNRILAALPAADFSRMEPDLEPVSLSSGEVLYEAGDTLGYLYFPTTCLVSLIASSAAGYSSELAMTGDDGVVGVAVVLDGETATHRLVVRGAGEAYRFRAELARWEFNQHGKLEKLVLRYAHVLITRIARTAFCNRHHTVDQQLCRWLLLSLDRQTGDKLNITHAEISTMLGVRREAVTEAAGRLQAAGLISYSRGRVSVLARAGLESRACECYAAAKAEGEHQLQPLPDMLARHRTRPNPASTRKLAEQRALQLETIAPEAPADKDRLLRELRLHEIELEMRNEELARAYAEADALRNEYADIYDFSPVAYVTVDALGVIRQINLAGAILLGLKRSEIQRHRFGASVVTEDIPTFTRFLALVLEGRARRQCEIGLAATGHRPPAIVTIVAVANESADECRMVLADVTAQRTAERKLRERAQYQRALLDTFPFMVWLKDEESRFLSVNRPFAEAFGWPDPESLVGKSDLDVASPDLARAYRDEDRAVLESGQPRHVEEQIESGGQRTWHETFKSPVMVDGRVIGTVGFARDITARKQAEVALIASNLRQQTLIETMPDLVLALDVEGHVTDFHPPAGMMPEDIAVESLIGKHFREAFPADAADALANAIAGMIEDDRPRRFTAAATWQGRRLEFSATLSKISAGDGQAAGYLCVARDVTEENIVRGRERLLVSALEAVGNGVVITDTDATIEWANPAFEALTGYTRGEAVSRSPADLIKSGRQGKEFYKAMWAAIRAGQVWRGELVNQRKDGALYQAELTIAPVRDEAGVIRHYVGIQHDIGDRMRLEQETRRQVKTESAPGASGHGRAIDDDTAD